jgi:hypothetical protein
MEKTEVSGGKSFSVTVHHNTNTEWPGIEIEPSRQEAGNWSRQSLHGAQKAPNPKHICQSERQDIQSVYNNFIYHIISSIFRPLRQSLACRKE